MNYLYEGNEAILIRKYVDEVIAASGADINDIHRYDTLDRDFDVANVVDDLNSLPFLSERKVVILRDTKGLDDDSAFVEYIKKPLYEVDFIVYNDEGSFKANSLYKKNRKYFKCQSATKSSDFFADANNLITSYGLSVDTKTRELLLQYAGGSISALMQSLDKLALYPEAIDEDVVFHLCDRSIDTDIFALTNAIFAGDVKKSLNIIRDFETLSYSVFYIIAVLASQLRFYNELRYYDNKHYTMSQIMEATGAKEYRIRISHDVLSRYRDTDFLGMLDKLATLDQTIKSNDDMNDYTRLELFIIDMIGEYDAGY